MNVLFVCTTGKDRSPALARHWKRLNLMDNVAACGINRFTTGQANTAYCSQYCLEWADLIVCAESIHENWLTERTDKTVINVKFGDHSRGPEIEGRAGELISLAYFLLTKLSK